MRILVLLLMLQVATPARPTAFVWDEDRGGGQITYAHPADDVFKAVLAVAAQLSNISFHDRELRTLTAKFHVDVANSTVRYTAEAVVVDEVHTRVRIDVHGTRFGLRGRYNDRSVEAFVEALSRRLVKATP